jgi:hypothetical protein
MTGIDPETGETVDKISKTSELRAALRGSERLRGRSFADIVSVLEDKAWKRGFLIGAIAGVAIGVIGYKLWLAIQVWLGA